MRWLTLIVLGLIFSGAGGFATSTARAADGSDDRIQKLEGELKQVRAQLQNIEQLLKQREANPHEAKRPDSKPGTRPDFKPGSKPGFDSRRAEAMRKDGPRPPHDAKRPPEGKRPDDAHSAHKKPDIGRGGWDQLERMLDHRHAQHGRGPHGHGPQFGRSPFVGPQFHARGVFHGHPGFHGKHHAQRGHGMHGHAEFHHRPDFHAHRGFDRDGEGRRSSSFAPERRHAEHFGFHRGQTHHGRPDFARGHDDHRGFDPRDFHRHFNRSRDEGHDRREAEQHGPRADRGPDADHRLKLDRAREIYRARVAQGPAGGPRGPMDFERRLMVQRGPEGRGPDARGPDARGGERRGPEARGPSDRGPEARGPQDRKPEWRGSEGRGPDAGRPNPERKPEAGPRREGAGDRKPEGGPRDAGPRDGERREPTRRDQASEIEQPTPVVVPEFRQANRPFDLDGIFDLIELLDRNTIINSIE